MVPVKRPQDDLRALATDLRASVSSQTTAQAINAAFAARQRGARRLGLVVAILGLMLVANVAFAGVADAAVPGDIFYPLDRAHEWIADRLGDVDHTSERVTEAQILVERQDYGRALALAIEIGVDAGASAALLEELENVDLTDTDSGIKEQVLALVAAAGNVSTAAQSGDKDALRVAIAAVHDAANEVAERASGGQAGGPGAGSEEGQFNQGGQAESEPDKKADSPSNTAPGQIDENTTTTISVTTPDTAPGGGQGGGDQGGGQEGGQVGGQGQGNKP